MTYANWHETLMAVHLRWHFSGLQWPERLGTPSVRPVIVLMPLHFSGDRPFSFMRSSMRTKIKIALGIVLPTKLDLFLTRCGGRLLVPSCSAFHQLTVLDAPAMRLGRTVLSWCPVWWEVSSNIKTQQRGEWSLQRPRASLLFLQQTSHHRDCFKWWLELKTWSRAPPELKVRKTWRTHGRTVHGSSCLAPQSTDSWHNTRLPRSWGPGSNFWGGGGEAGRWIMLLDLSARGFGFSYPPGQDLKYLRLSSTSIFCLWSGFKYFGFLSSLYPDFGGPGPYSEDPGSSSEAHEKSSWWWELDAGHHVWPHPPQLHLPSWWHSDKLFPQQLVG